MKDFQQFKREMLQEIVNKGDEAVDIFLQAYAEEVKKTERERIAKLLNVQEDKDGNLFIELDDVVKEALSKDV